MNYFCTKIYPKDYQSTVTFYHSLLKLPVTQEYENALLLGEHLLLCRDNRFHTPGPVTLYFETDDFTALKEKIKTEGISAGHRVSPAGQQIIMLSDPDGNLVEIGESMQNIVSALLQLSLRNS